MVTQAGQATFFYGYIIIFAGFIIQAVAWGTGNSFGVFFDPLITEFGWSRAAISGALSMGFLVHGVSSMVLGNLNDRFGPRLIMSVCSLFIGTGFLLMTRIDSVWHLYLFYGLIVSIGLGGIDVIPLSTVSRWFYRQRGMMSGIVKVGTGLGMFVMPFFINWLLTGYGWRHSFLVLALINCAFVLFLAQFLVRDPVQKQQYADNDLTNAHDSHTGTEQGLAFKEAMRTRQLWIICMVYFIILFCAYTIIMHIVQHAIDIGLPSGAAAGVLSTVGGVSIFGRLVMGGAGDRIGEKTGLISCLLILLVALCWLQAVNALWMFYLFAMIYGFAHGGFFALVSPLIARFFGTRSHGLLFGIVIFCSTVGGAIGPLMAGYLFDVTNSYSWVFSILAGMCVLAVVLTAALKPIARQ
ncbi:MAG: MFS transporter [Desulfobacteraceae bacterium]|nr:MAG: MFS transporter [Desulfobacteraceae bacterium]